MTRNHLYRGTFDNLNWYVVTRDAKKMSPRRSIKIRCHSPTGYSWGYFGSGPSQLALALLLDNVDQSIAERLYMRYKEQVIAGLPQEGGWLLRSSDILAWVKKVSEAGE